MLLSASHNQYKIKRSNGQEVILEPGDFPFGRNAWSKWLHIPPRTISNWLSTYHSSAQIVDKVVDNLTPSILSIKKWKLYQPMDNLVDMPMDNPMDTTNNGINQELTNQPSETRPSGRSRCPILLKEKYPHLSSYKDHHECIEFIGSIAAEFKHGQPFVNFGKQIFHLHNLLRAGYNFDQIGELINQIEKVKFYKDNWDLATVVSYHDRKGGDNHG